jgi:hypothetical protein
LLGVNGNDVFLAAAGYLDLAVVSLNEIDEG